MRLCDCAIVRVATGVANGVTEVRYRIADAVFAPARVLFREVDGSLADLFCSFWIGVAPQFGESETIADCGGDVERLMGRHPFQEISCDLVKTSCEVMIGTGPRVGTAEHHGQAFVESRCFSVSNTGLTLLTRCAL